MLLSFLSFEEHDEQHFDDNLEKVREIPFCCQIQIDKNVNAFRWCYRSNVLFFPNSQVLQNKKNTKMSFTIIDYRQMSLR